MAEKISMNKNTLAALKNELKEYRGALPVFEMKEQQLKEVLHTIEDRIVVLQNEVMAAEAEVRNWVAVMAEDTVDLSALALLSRVVTGNQEVAGVSLTLFEEVLFEDYALDPYTTPLWVDSAKEVLRSQKRRQTRLQIERENVSRLQKAVAEARRMKNALKEVFIPEAMANIRKIEIYLGDVERLAIGCAKLVKKKKQAKQAIL